VNTIGWLFILAALLLGRQISKGRALNLPDDLSDAFLAITRGDTDALTEVLSRTGDSNTPVTVDDTGTFAPHIAGSGLAASAQALGSKAKGYRWAGTGPDYYDCSGLMYAACKVIGYTGSRFNTASILGNKAFKKISMPGVQGPGLVGAQVNDIVLWLPGQGGVTGHMGVITGNNQFYSARSVKTGIGVSPINSFRKVDPFYVRYVGAA
jgi:cell wall-associated NlpC family hydrolase